MNKRLPAEQLLPPGSAPLLLEAAYGCGTATLPPGGPYVPHRARPGIAPQKKNGGRAQPRRDQSLVRDALFTVRRNNEHHIVAEGYFYKTEPYYTILSLENEGHVVKPSSSAVLDAYVIPICLERARMAGIPVCDWGISQAYVPLPAILYGLNYFATNDEYAIVKDNASAKATIRHITNNGKYPFCFQKFPEGSTICPCTAIFGEAVGAAREISAYAAEIYDLFGIPLMKMVFLKNDDTYALSSLSPVRYTELSDGERALLSAYIASQEFL